MRIPEAMSTCSMTWIADYVSYLLGLKSFPQDMGCNRNSKMAFPPSFSCYNQDCNGHCRMKKVVSN